MCENDGSVVSNFLGNDSNGVIDEINKLLASLLPVANGLITAEIKSNGLDPWPLVTGDKVSAGEIDLGICTATAYAKYALTDFNGLSTLELTSIEATSAKVGATETTCVFSLKAHLTDSFSGKVSGTATAKCGFIAPSATIGGTALAQAVKATGTGTLTLKRNGGKLQITGLTLSNLNVYPSELLVHISLDLFIFTILEDAIASIIANVLSDQVGELIAYFAEDPLNDVFKDMMPFPD